MKNYSLIQINFKKLKKLKKSILIIFFFLIEINSIRIRMSDNYWTCVSFQFGQQERERPAEGAPGRVRRERDQRAAAVRGAGRQSRDGAPAVQQFVAGQRHRPAALREAGAPASPHRRRLHAPPGTGLRAGGHSLYRHWMGSQIWRFFFFFFFPFFFSFLKQFSIFFFNNKFNFFYWFFFPFYCWFYLFYL